MGEIGLLGLLGPNVASNVRAAVPQVRFVRADGFVAIFHFGGNFITLISENSQVYLSFPNPYKMGDNFGSLCRNKTVHFFLS